MKRTTPQSLTSAAATALLREWALKNRVIKVTVLFNGSGDSGSIESPELEFEPGVPEGVSQIAILSELPTALNLERIAERALEDTGVDWYNNEGGNGCCTINPRTGEMSVEINQAVTTYDTTEHPSFLGDQF